MANRYFKVLCALARHLELDSAPLARARRVLPDQLARTDEHLHPDLRLDLGNGITFKFDIGDPWHHEQLPAGSAVKLSCPVGSTLAIPAD